MEIAMDNKYSGYKLASAGESMRPFVNWIKTWSTLEVHNVFELGANFAQDAEFIAKSFGISDKDVWVFEAHPQMCDVIKKIHKFNAFNYAVYNKEKIITFNAVDIDKAENTGISSILKNQLSQESTTQVQVPAIRMDKFLKEHNIDSVDFLKLDVEGCNYEALEGFGKRLKDVKSIHIEAEHVDYVFGKNALFPKIEKLLKHYNFEMVYFQRYSCQSDSFWLQKKYLKDDRV